MQPSWHRVPGQGAYARPERERRFRLAGEPPPSDEAVEVEDRYLRGTRLRLRTMSSPGAEPVRKLTQKVRPDPDDPSQALTTTAYLSAQEHAVLAALPADVLRKTRTRHRTGRLLLAVDAFAGPLDGLRLVEVEVEDLAAPLALPGWVGSELTGDDRFSGGRLAVLDAEGARTLLD